VTTAESRALVPAAFALISGARTAENIVAAFRQLNPAFNLTPSQISPLALQLLNTRNPKTGDFIIPSASGASTRRDPSVNIGGSFGTIGGDPLVELRQVVPADFQQYQGSGRLDWRLSSANKLSASYFFGDYPSLDPFPDPSTMASPWVLRRSNRGQVAALGNTHFFSNATINEFRAGFFALRNTRRLDDPFLAQDMTGAAFGISNPALLFDDSPGTRRLGHFIDRGFTWSFGGTNDSANRREQRTLHFSDAVTMVRGNHSVKFGAEFKLHDVKTNLPEEQATEFEKIENWQHFLLGLTPEADTQFGITEKNFTSRDVGLFLTDDWRVNRDLTVNLGVRWDWYGWPEEKRGYFGNFILPLVQSPDNPFSGIVVPANAENTGISSIDPALAQLPRAATNSTLSGQDLNNVAPRVGFAWTPGGSNRWAVRGGYGMFYDRPSAAFMNTVFSNYPHLREVEITAPSRRVDIRNAFSSYLPASGPPPVTAFFPFQVVYSGGAAGSYTLFDGTGLGRAIGNPAETLEFRAVDADLKTPYYHHFNLGVQYEIFKDVGLEVRYAGSRGRDLLMSKSFNIPWDLNDPRTPQFIFDRITRSFRAAGGQPSAADPQGLGYGYGGNKNNGPNNAVIGAEIRAPYLGFNDREAVILTSEGRSEYDALQVALTKRFSKGYEFHAAYTLAKSMDLFSADPGSTAGSGRPDEANVGFSVENDARDLEANWAPSDFDRQHRFSLSGIVELPAGFELGAYAQFQSGRPYSVYAFESGLLSLVFQRLDFAPGANASTAEQQAANPEEGWFNKAAFVRANAAGNTPRNFLRGPSQKRVDLSLAKRFRVGGESRVELRAEVFNVFNWVNFAMPTNNIASADFGTITNTIGGPRTAQLGLRLTF
jgi:outer membrane receptor protein involved in Fe transport